MSNGVSVVHQLLERLDPNQHVIFIEQLRVYFVLL